MYGVIDKCTVRIVLFAVSATYKFVPNGSTLIPEGLLNCACARDPFVEPAIPVPETVVTTAVATTILRILLLPLSETYKFVPVESIQIPLGLLNDAKVPVPSEYPADPLPAKVVKVAVAITSLLIVFVPVLQIYRVVPVGSIHISVGELVFVSRFDTAPDEIVNFLI